MGRRTVLGASLAGLAGVGIAGPAASQDDLPNDLALTCLGDRLEYAFEVDGQVAFGDEAGDRDEIEDGTTVSGTINGRGRDDYRFSGSITAFEITEGADDARVVLNGEEVDPADLSGGDVGAGQADPYEITVRAGSDEAAYELTVDGTLEQAAEGSGAEVEDSTASATIVGGDEHAYRFRGVAMWLEVSEGVAAFDVALADDGSTPSDLLPHRLVVYGLDEEAVEYRFAVSDALEFGDAVETEPTDIPPDERVEDTTVVGHVHAHDDGPLADDYRFAGSLTFERAEGPVRVKLKPNDVPDPTGTPTDDGEE